MYPYIRISLLIILVCFFAEQLFCQEENVSNEYLGRTLSSKEIAENYLNDYQIELFKFNDDSLSILNGVSMHEVWIDLKYMVNHPNSSTIGERGHYCGPAAIINWLLNCRPDVYVNVVWHLAKDGKCQLGSGSYTLKLPKKICNRVDYTIEEVNRDEVTRKDIRNTSLSDFIICSALVYSEKSVQRVGLIFPKATYRKKSLGSFLYTNTMPWEIDDFFNKMGFNMDAKAFYWGEKEDIKELFKIEEAVVQGNMPIVFDNHYISFTKTKNFLYRTLGAHFITIHDFKINKDSNTVDYSYWDYGKVKPNPFLSLNRKPLPTGSLKKDMRAQKRFKKKGLHLRKREITVNEFLTAMKGYWIPSDKKSEVVGYE